MQITILSEDFDPHGQVSQYQREHLTPGGYGACSIFVGTMRDFNQGCAVDFMQLEHYAGMTESLLTQYASEVIQRYDLLDLLILHRVGRVLPNDPIVAVACWSAHRAAAFDGTRDMMEYLKSNATFWKKETLKGEDGDEGETERWVDNV